MLMYPGRGSIYLTQIFPGTCQLCYAGVPCTLYLNLTSVLCGVIVFMRALWQPEIKIGGINRLALELDM